MSMKKDSGRWTGIALGVAASLLLLGVVSAQEADVDADALTLNLKNADIEALITTVSELTGKNFVVDPRVNGKVTVISALPTDKDALYEVFLSILKVQGFAAIPDENGLTKIVPEVVAKQEPVALAELSSRRPGAEIVTAVLKLNNVVAAEVVPVLRPLLPQEAHLAAHAPSNTLVAADSAGNLDRLLEIIERIDQSAASEIEVFPLRYAAAADIVNVIQTLSSGGPTTRQPLAVDERTNSILIGGDSKRRLEIRALIAHLDTPIQPAGNIEVVYLRYANATDLVPILQAIGDQLPAGGAAGDTAQPGATPAPQANDAGRARTPAGRTQPVGVSDDADFQIQADENTNALVIQADPGRMETLMQVIRKLDIRRAQVLVETVIVEVTDSLSSELGIQWQSVVPNSDGTFGGIVLPGSLNSIGSIVTDTGVNLATGGTVGYLTDGSLRAVLQAFAGESFTDILSTPSLLMLDNSEAEIVVGENVPFVTGQFTNQTTTPDNPFQTIERQDVGVILRISPQINEGDAVTMEIEQEISSVAPGTSGADLVTSERSITTNVLVDDGQIIVLGGLIQDEVTETIQKVPLLGDLPVLGNLFRNTRTASDKNDLIVFIRPTIVRTKDDALGITRDKYTRFRDMQLSRRGGSVPLMPNKRRPQLPEWDAVPPSGIDSAEEPVDLRTGP